MSRKQPTNFQSRVRQKRLFATSFQLAAFARLFARSPSSPLSPPAPAISPELFGLFGLFQLIIGAPLAPSVQLSGQLVARRRQLASQRRSRSKASRA